jgi:serine/threonine protein kinase
MSPEQVKDKPIDARTDLFSLGCTMYRLLTGSYAFPGVTREDRLIKRIRQGHVPITDVRSDLPYRLTTIVDRLLAVRPTDRFGTAAELAEALEALGPSTTNRPERGPNTKRGTRRPDDGPLMAPVEPEAPLDWSMIESALRPTGKNFRESARQLERNEPKLPGAKGLSSHRKALETDGLESGREAHEKYRTELVQMKKVMSELRAMEPPGDKPPEVESWLERIGEWFGDYLADPSPSHIIIAVLVVLLVLVFAFSMVIG